MDPNPLVRNVSLIAKDIFGDKYNRFFVAVCLLPEEFDNTVTWNGISQGFKGKYREAPLWNEFRIRLESANLISTKPSLRRSILVKKNFIFNFKKD